MTVPAQTTLFNESTANGATTIFPYQFKIATADDLAVELDGVVQTDGFTVTGIGEDNGGNIVFSVAPENGVTVLRYLDPELSRDTDYQQFGDWMAGPVNLDFDRLWLAIQGIALKLGLCVRAPISSSSVVLPEPVANNIIGWNSDANGFQNYPPSDNTLLSLALGLPSGSSLIGFNASTLFDAGTSGAAIRDRGVSVKDFPFLAVGDGVTDDTAAIQAAANSLAATGGTLYLPATGHAYKTSDTIALANGVVLVGSPAKNFAGSTATNAQWAAAGSWINPTHASNPAVRLQGHGSGISGVGFIHNQPIPSGSWTPNTYGYCIEQIASHTTIEDILIVNASHGIYMKYTTGSGGGTQVRWRDVIISAFAVRMRTTMVNDTAYLSNIHMRNLWYSSSALVTAYIRANTKGWYCGYTDNIMVDGIEFFEDSVAMYFEDETCLGNTHSLYNATLSNVQFNLPQVCMKVANSTTAVAANFSNVISQTGNAFGYTWADTAFQLGSDNVNIKFNGLAVRDAGGQVFTVGGGTSGKVVIDSLDIEKYSSAGSGQVGVAINTGAQVRLSNYRIIKISGAGSRFGGAGLENLSTDSFGQILLSLIHI